MRKAAIASGVIGLILLVAAGLMAWWITPSYIARLPANYNKTRSYTGTIKMVVNPAALSTGNLSAAIRTGLPASLTENVKVLQTSGNTAEVQDTRTISAAGGLLAKIISKYAVNRQTLAATTSHPGDWSVVPARGLTVSWPLGAKKQNYTGWNSITQTTTPLKYVTQTPQGGISTYEYRSTIPPTPIKNPQVLARLPKSLPASLVPHIVAAGIISHSQAASLSRAFPRAKAIPLGYTYQATDTYFVAPPTGLVVNVSANESEVGAIALPNGTLVPLIPVLADTYHATPSSLSAAVSDARNGSSTITTWGVTVPIIGAAVGFLLVVLAVLLWIFGRTRGRGVEATTSPRHPSPAGRVG
jgi:Porin PorA